MRIVTRRAMVAGGATLAALLPPRKPRAARLPDIDTAMKPITPPVEAPDIEFQAADGSAQHLSAYRGRGVAINFWATWCAPCVAEMPALDALAKALAPDGIAVLPLSSDRGGADVVTAWYRANGIVTLPVLMDARGQAARAMQARGIPTTVVVNRRGLLCARLEGAADWSSDKAIALLRALVET